MKGADGREDMNSCCVDVNGCVMACKKERCILARQASL